MEFKSGSISKHVLKYIQMIYCLSWMLMLIFQLEEPDILVKVMKCAIFLQPLSYVKFASTMVNTGGEKYDKKKIKICNLKTDQVIKKVIGVKRSCRVKLNSYGSENRSKARFVDEAYN